jgi:hypothetical protein
MKKFVNGQYIELTPAEIAEMESAQRKAEIAERRRPLTEAEVSRMLITDQINTLSVDDATALRMREFYPTFDELCDRKYTAEEIGYKFQYGDKLYKTRQAKYKFVSHYPPGVGMESLYEVIDETHAGTLDDPIPYSGNMVLEQGKYYMQGGEIYRCTRDTGVPVYNPLAELVGQYVEIV